MPFPLNRFFQKSRFHQGLHGSRILEWRLWTRRRGCHRSPVSPSAEWWKWCENFWQLEMLLEKKCILKYINFEIFSLRLIQIANRKILPRLIRQRSQQKGGVFSSTRSLPFETTTGNEKPEPFFWPPPKKNTSPKNLRWKNRGKNRSRRCLELRRGALCHADRLGGRVFGVPGTLSPIGVSENSGTSKSSILIGCSIINHPFGDTPYSRKHPHSHGSGKWVP